MYCKYGKEAHNKDMKKLLISIVVVLSLSLAGVFFAAASTASVPQKPVERVPGLLTAVNEYRATKHLKPLTLNAQLNQSAQTKAADMVKENYWEHTSPTGVTPWHYVDQAGYEYDKAAENLARCFDSGEVAVAGWIKSPAHEAALRGDFKDMGVGVVHNEKDNCDYVVSHFGRE